MICSPLFDKKRNLSKFVIQSQESLKRMGKSQLMAVRVFKHALKLNASAVNITISNSTFFDNLYVF